MEATPWRDRQAVVDGLARHGGYHRSVTGGIAKTGAVTKLGHEWGCSQTTITLWIGNHRIEPTLLPGPPPPLVPIESEEFTLVGDFGVSSDWHAPLTKYDVLHRMLADCEAAGLERHIIAGDLTNQDAWSGHEEKQKGAGPDAEIEHLSYSVSTALDYCSELVVSLGNHDRHMKNKLGVTLDESLRMLLRSLPADKLARIRITERDYVLVETEMGLWRICHTYSYSRQPLAYPNRLALRHGCHIAAGHRHHAAQGYAANGKMIVELGGIMDADRMAYTKRYTNDLPVMVNSYGLLVDGRMRCPMLYS